MDAPEVPAGEVNLGALFAPRSIAIVGASDRSYYARNVYENSRRLGMPDDNIVLVNPNRTEAFGRACVPRLDRAIDLAVVVTPAAAVTQVVSECATAGARACVVLSAGFAEKGDAGRAIQDELAAAARVSGIALLGPNTMGVIAPHAGLGAWGGRLPALEAGGVAAIFQSSGLINLVVGLLARRRIGIRFAASVGNEAALTLADALAHAVDDEETRVVALFVESISDAPALRAALERADERRKPVIALRVGRSERARRNVIAHTGRLAASGETWDALLAQHGVVAVRNLDELVETTALFARASAFEGQGAGVLTISGGDCTLLADLAERAGLELAEPSRIAELRALVGKPALVGNPLDVEDLWRSDPETFFRAAEIFAAERFGVTAFRLNLPERPDAVRDGYARIAKAVRAGGHLPVFLSRASEPVDEAWHAFFHELDVPFLQEYERSLRAIAALLRRRARTPRTRREVRRHAIANDARDVLKDFGIPFARTESVSSADGAVRAAERLGYPVVVKAWTAHKSDLGAIRLGLLDPGGVRAAFADVAARAPGADVVVQPMERGVAEILVGIVRDEQLGPVLVCGIGGVFVEALGDVALRIPPIDRDDALEMIDELRGRALLYGARGRPRADIDALADVLVRVGDLGVAGAEEIDELDLNPVLVRAQGDGVVALDVLLVRRRTSTDPSTAPVASTTTP